MTRLVLVVLLAVVVPVAGAALDPAQQDCVRRLAANTAALATAQAAANQACLRGVDAQACLATDTAAVTKARDRLAGDVRARCERSPAFGAAPRIVDTPTAAATLHERGLVADLFGPDLDAARASGKQTARCQAVLLRRAARMLRARVQDNLRCTTSMLATADAGTLAACATRPAVAVERARTRLAKVAAGACADTPLPGRCANRAGADLADCLTARVACRACRLLDSAGALGVDCELADDGLANDSCRIPVAISGNAIPFNGGNNRIAGAEIWILERPERRVVTSTDGAFVFDDLPEGSEATLVLDHPDYHAIQTSTIRLGPQGAERVTFQAVVHPIYDALAALLGVTPDPAKCQIVTTVTRVGKSLYDPGAHGEDGATTTLVGPGWVEGPIYFNSSVLPDRTRHETSDDGGVLYLNAEPGRYGWTATKPGAAFSSLTMTCRPGVLVNASPPWGLQRQ